MLEGKNAMLEFIDHIGQCPDIDRERRYDIILAAGRLYQGMRDVATNPATYAQQMRVL